MHLLQRPTQRRFLSAWIFFRVARTVEKGYDCNIARAENGERERERTGGESVAWKVGEVSACSCHAKNKRRLFVRRLRGVRVPRNAGKTKRDRSSTIIAL